MRGREVRFLALGLVVGLLFGAVLVGTNAELRTNLFGSALPPTATSAYYLVDLASTSDWLTEKAAAEAAATDGEILTDSLQEVNELPAAENFREAFRTAQTAIDKVLTETYVALGGESLAQPLSDVQQAATFACLGLDDNPYSTSGPGLYMYMKIPTQAVGSVPTTWEALETPKENDLYWQLLACQPNVESGK